MIDQTQKPRAAIYLRVSTNEQSTSMQRSALLKLAEERGYEVVEIFEDAGVSGSRRSRPGLDRMMAAVEAGELACVLVYKFDRLARSLSHLLQCVEEFERHGVAFVSAIERVDDGPTGKLLLNLLGAVAEFERSIITERVRSGLQHARERGVELGRPRVHVPVEAALSLIEDSGCSVREAARRLGVSRGTLIRRLKELEEEAPDQNP